MIIGIDKKELQKQREQKYNEYAILLNSSNPSLEELNALKSELKYLDDQLNRINGLNDKIRTEELKNKKSGKDEKISKYLKFIRFSIIRSNLHLLTHCIQKDRIPNHQYLDSRRQMY